MAMGTLVPTWVPILQDATRCLATSVTASAAAPPKLHLSSRFSNCKVQPGESRRKSKPECGFQISDFMSTTHATKHRGRRAVSARASGAPSGDVLTEDATENSTVEDETCEIVQGSNVTLGEGPDTVQAYLIQALKNNNGVAVLCLTDDYGFENEENRSFAYRLACFGYNVLVPDLFQGTPWTEDMPESEHQKWLEDHSPDVAAGSIDEAIKYLVEEIDTVGKLVVIGFGFGGGRLMETLARDSEGLFATAAFFYGTGFESSLAAQIKVPLLLIGGDGDPLCPVDVIRQIERQVQGSKAKIYPGLGHAFVHRPSNSEEDEVSEDAFTEARHWLHESLLLDSTE
ncbi:unnamed protein product [Calypogeia fissa]